MHPKNLVLTFFIFNVFQFTITEKNPLREGYSLKVQSTADIFNHNINKNIGINEKENMEFVIPQIIYSKNRIKREIDESLSYQENFEEFMVKLGKYNIKLQPNQNLQFLLKSKSIWYHENFTREIPISKCYPSIGTLTKTSLNSYVFATLCDSKIYGVIYTPNETISIEPSRNSHQLHVLQTKPTSDNLIKSLFRQKRNAPYAPTKTWEYFNLTGDTFDLVESIENFGLDELKLRKYEKKQPKLSQIETDNNNDNNLWPIHENIEEDVGYFVDSAWDLNFNKIHSKPSPELPQRWLEIALAVDHSVISFHGRERVEHYVLSLMNIVSAIYQDPSLEANIQLLITRLLFYENKKQGVVRPANAKKSLENVNAWNRRLLVSLSPGEDSHDVAVWLTRIDIGGPSGYAPVGGACDPKRSCALNKDEGLSSAFIIAHEMGHMLGLTHDGDDKQGNDCGEEGNDGSVMAPMVSATFHKFSWSHCSKQELKLKLNKWYCLKNHPSGSSEIYLNGTLHATFTMDEQCRMEFGEGYEMCRAFDVSEPCSHLWCNHIKSPLVCKTKKGPPLEGTECGFNKWCIDGYCQDVDVSKFGINPVIHNPQDGGWSAWSEWGHCSRSCGTGVQFKTRKCDNPKPSFGGTDCFGSSEEWRLCNTEKCPGPLTDLRAQQCSNLPNLLNLNEEKRKITWLPFESDDDNLKCQLICIGKENKEVYMTGENLFDGTPCSYNNSNNICIQGVCQPVGCDGKLFSVLKEDVCGLCGGNNTECKEIKKTHKRKIKRELSRLSVIPKNSREITIQVNLTTSSFAKLSVAFILKDRQKRKYFLPIPNTNIFNEIVEGTRFIYETRNNLHTLSAKGPLLAEIIIFLHLSQFNIDIGVNISFTSSFFLNKNLLNNDGRYGWVQGGWGACTASCGGGKRQKTAACWDKLNGRIVAKKHCSLAFKPSLETEKCNTFSCNFQWLTGQWEPCSATCGSKGIQNREMYCVHRSVALAALESKNDSIREHPYRYMVAPNKCAGNKPQSTRPCYRIPCPSYWEFGEWSQCSASCGLGISTRQAKCTPLSEDETFYTCGSFPPFQNRVCAGSESKKGLKTCKKKRKCNGDQSKYCSIKELLRYCQVSGFRKLCCSTCKQHQKLAPVIS